VDGAIRKSPGRAALSQGAHLAPLPKLTLVSLFSYLPFISPSLCQTADLLSVS